MINNIKNDELSNIALMKDIMILFVVLAHSSFCYAGWVYSSPYPSPFFAGVTHYINSFHMAGFVFCSGFLFYFLRYKVGKYQEFKGFIKNKFTRLMVPYLFVGIFWISPIRKCIGFYNDSILSIWGINVFLGKDPGPAWFLLMLFNVFALFYAFDKLVLMRLRNNIWMQNILLLVVFTASVILMESINIVFNHPIATFQISNTIKYFPFFFLGYEVRKQNSNINIYLIKYFYVIGIIHYLLVYFDKLDLLVQPILGILFWYGVISAITNKYKNLESNSGIQFIRNNSFAIFLFHEPVIFVILSYIVTLPIQPIFLVSTCFFLSIFVSVLLKKCIENVKI